jgi:hypothetical protein
MSNIMGVRKKHAIFGPYVNEPAIVEYCTHLLHDGKNKSQYTAF